MHVAAPGVFTGGLNEYRHARSLIMPILPTSILPKNILAIIKRPANQVQVSPLLVEIAQHAPADVLGKLQTNENGLSEEEAQERLEKYGPNVIAQEQRLGRLRLWATPA